MLDTIFVSRSQKVCLTIKNFINMSEEKTYVFGESGANSIISALAPMLSNRGIDPGVLAMMNNNDGFGNGGW